MTQVLVSFLLSLSIVADASRTIVNHAANASAKGFVCPDECQHCCTAHSWDLGFMAFGVSGERYKCVLKNSKVLPSADCQPIEQRTHSTRQAKTQCPFTADMGEEPWKTLEETPCPKITSCCCDKNDQWSERQCLDETGDRVTAPSSNPKAEGKDQTFVKDYQRYQNGGACKGDESMKYEYHGSMKGSLGFKGKCCIRRKFHRDTVKKAGTRRMEGGYFCGPEMCAGDPHCDMGSQMCSQQEKWDYETFEWYSCEEYESLHFCSDDDGVTSNGKTHYYRVPDGKGKCEPSATCPSGFSKTLKDGKTGRSLGSCRCDADCGR